MNDLTVQKQFENEVRRIACELWPGARHDGAETVHGQERDGIFNTEDITHLIECTTSKGKDKAFDDANKLAKLANSLRSKDPTRPVKCWFITRDETTGDQREAVKRAAIKHQTVVEAISFAQFRRKLIDVSSYLEARSNYPFGSVRDPASGSPRFDLPDYVPLEMVEPSKAGLWSFQELLEKIVVGKRFVVLGDYGAGKSSTLRQLFKELAKDVWKAKTSIFPVMLNLRDHHGQKDPAEALERHAKGIGFSDPAHLVRAWRAGYVTLLLDGFDEVATAGWAGRTKKLQDLRYQSMELVRQFVRQTPENSAVIISGRAHFFDHEKELARALQLDDAFVILNLNEFTELQVSEFLQNKGWHQSIPDWLPSRPLLLGYLASKNLLKETLSGDGAPTPAAGWHSLLQRICKRESEIEVGVDPDTIRHIIERLASFARKTSDGLGPLLPDQVTQAFIEVVGQPPDDRGHVLIQRLPGLGVNVGKSTDSDAFNAQDGSRRFIDPTFAETAAAGDVFRYVEDPFHNHVDASEWMCSLQPLGVEVLAHRCATAGFADGKLSAAIGQACSNDRQGTLAADIVRALMTLGQRYTGSQAFVRSVEIPELHFDDAQCDMSALQFQEAVIHEVALSPEVAAEVLPTFENSIVAELHGRVGWSDVPREKFPGTEIDRFEDEASTNTAILRQANLSPSTKVLMTVLRKLYVQKGRGRRENALFRGIDPSMRHLVTGVLGELRKEGFVTQAHYTDQVVWIPTRSTERRQRALRIINAPHDKSDSLVRSCSELK